MQKVQNALIQAYLKARMEMLRLENEEDGLETVETVILVAVAVVVAVCIYQALTGGTQDGSKGLVGSIFSGIETKINQIFGGASSNPTVSRSNG